MSARPSPRAPVVSLEEYLRSEAAAEQRSEYDDGQVWAMAGASRNHNQLVANVSAGLIGWLREKPCNSYATDMRVAIQRTRFYYPDVVVACDPEQYDEAHDPPSLLNPVAILEVLSPPTEARDRGEKFLWYQAIPSLREYVLISQWPRRIEYFLRGDDGAWAYHADAIDPRFLEVRSVGLRIPIDEVYNKVGGPSA